VVLLLHVDRPEVVVDASTMFSTVSMAVIIEWSWLL
jgi:hypothetical protein